MVARMSNNNPADAIAGMARTGAPRVPVGDSAVQAVRNTSGGDTAEFKEARKNTQSGDPVGNDKSNRSYKSVSGPAFGIKAHYNPSQSPEAGRTQNNVRTLPSAINRPRTNFDGGRTS